jgi:ADP-ribose pyrophosphatase
LRAPVDARAAGGIHGLADESEDIRVVPMDFAAAWQALLDGRLNSPPPIMALQWLALRRLASP